MSLALESVCNELGLRKIDDAATRLVAEKIIELTRSGMRAQARGNLRVWGSLHQ